MCTVSVICIGPASLRLVSNRDELVARAPALEPEWRTLGAGRALWPTDPVGGGTWIAANERGLVLAILNLNLEPSPTLPGKLASRGQIIPRLARASSWQEAVDLSSTLLLEAYAPFRLLAVEASAAGLVGAVLRWDRSRLTRGRVGARRCCLVSSGLGDSLVTPRLALFDELVPDAAPTSPAQDAFHAHAWPDEPAISVMMSRQGARTHSVTRVEVSPGVEGVRVAMEYHPVVWPGDQGNA